MVIIYWYIIEYMDVNKNLRVEQPVSITEGNVLFTQRSDITHTIEEIQYSIS